MAWRSKGKDNLDLINQLTENEVIKSDIVKEVMAATDRKFYSVHNPYFDAPQSIGYGVTISAPHMHAYSLDLLIDKLKPGARVLDVGAGSGYLTACFARILKSRELHDNSDEESKKNASLVIGIEHQPALVKLAKDNINSDDPSLIDNGHIIIIEGDGKLGCPEYAPYDAIHVGAAAAETPQEIINQLKPGGRLICPVGPTHDMQYLEQFDKGSDGTVKQKRLMGVMFVPLTDLNKS